MNNKNRLLNIAVLLVLSMGCMESLTYEHNGFIAIGETASDYLPTVGFQLDNSDYILVGFDGDASLDSPALAYCFSKEGAAKWAKRLPDNIREAQAGMPDRRGGFLLAGFHYGDSARPEPDVTIMRFDQHGTATDSRTIQAPLGFKRLNTVDMRWLDNGQIGLAITFEHGSGNPTPSFPRLVLLDPDLNVQYDNQFFPATGDFYTDINRLYVTQRKDGNLCVIGNQQYSFPYGRRSVAFVVDPTQMSIHEYHNLPVPLGLVPVAVHATPDGGVLIAGTVPDSTINQKVFQYTGTLLQPLGQKISILRLDSMWALKDRVDHTGITNYGTVMDMQPTSDGGYVILGTAGFSGNTNFELPQKIFLLKVSSSLQKEFMHEFQSSHSALGYRVREASDGGYLIAARIRSFDAHYNLMLMKTNRNGMVQLTDQ